MQKQIIPAALALILTLFAGSSYAPANPPDDKGCPPGLMLVDNAFGHPADANGDGIVCMLHTRRNTRFFDNRFPR